MLTLQEYIQEINRDGLLKFANDHLLKVAQEEKRFILNYSDVILGSPKDWHSHYSRGITLEENNGSYRIIAKPFNRFYNYQEAPPYLVGTPEEKLNFDEPFEVHKKADGSLILLYWWDNRWNVNTRGSFAKGKISPFTHYTWEEIFWETFPPTVPTMDLAKDRTHLFELCTPWNEVVEHFEVSFIKYLTSFTLGGEEIPEPLLAPIGCERIACDGLDGVLDALGKLPVHAEGFVLKQGSVRKKCKTENWAKLAHLREGITNHGVWELIFSGQHDEVKALFPHLSPMIDERVQRYVDEKHECAKVFESISGIQEQADFAREAMKYGYYGTLFLLRRMKSWEEAKVPFEKYLMKKDKTVASPEKTDTMGA